MIVNSAHSGQAIRRGDLAKIFLKKAKSWGDGGEIIAVDQSLKSEVRVTFTASVLEVSMMEILNYWRTQISRGRERPPQVKTSDREVVAFVAATPGSIGYVSESTQMTDAVKVVQIFEASP